MENKHNLNYFKKSGWQKPLGFALLVLGLLFLFFGWSYLSYILMIIFIPAGVALFLIGSSVRATDEEIDEFIQKNLADFNVALEEDRNYAKRILKHLPCEVIDGYKYEDGLMFTKTKTGSVRSSEFVRSIVYVLSDSLYIATRSVSIVSGEIKDRVYEISYTDVKDEAIKRERKTLSYAGKTFEVNLASLYIECSDGSHIDLPTPDTIGADQLVQRMKTVKEKFISSKEEQN